MAPFAGAQWIPPLAMHCLSGSPIEMGLTLLIHFKLALGLLGSTLYGFVVIILSSIGMFTAVSVYVYCRESNRS